MMNTFIKKHEFNYINKCMIDLNSAFRNCTDPNIVATTKSNIQNKIWNKFNSLTEEQRNILDISEIIDSIQIEGYLSKLDEYVYGMSKVTASQISKIFKKEKKLKMPNIDNQDSKYVYLGWSDLAIKKHFIVYNLDGKLLGMSCRFSDTNNNNTNVCTLCNHIGSQNEVAFVSSICKTSGNSLDSYKTVGFHVCMDTTKCNHRITSTEKLEELLKEVNNIKK